MKKRPIRILPMSLALAMSLSLAAPVSAVSLTDVAGPYAQSIEALAEKGVIKGDGTGAYRPDDPLTRSAAASLLYEAFDLVPVFSMEAPAPEANEDGTMPEPVTKQFYSTDTTVATLDAVLMPAAPDAVDTWAETAANTVLEARLMDQIDGEFRGEQDHDPRRVRPGGDEGGLRRRQGHGLPGPGRGGRPAARRPDPGQHGDHPGRGGLCCWTPPSRI